MSVQDGNKNSNGAEVVTAIVSALLLALGGTWMFSQFFKSPQQDPQSLVEAQKQVVEAQKRVINSQQREINDLQQQLKLKDAEMRGFRDGTRYGGR